MPRMGEIEAQLFLFFSIGEAGSGDNSIPAEFTRAREERLLGLTTRLFYLDN